MKNRMTFRSFALPLVVVFFSFSALAQNFDGRYDGTLLLTRDGGDCGEKIEKFQAQIKGAKIRIVTARAASPLEGEIESDGRFLVSGKGRNDATLEFRAQILSTKSGLGSLLIRRGDNFCQFLLSLKQN